MTANPQLRVMSSCGYFDLVCSYFANAQAAARLDPALAARVEVRNYGGGHAIYTEDKVRMELKPDVARFVQDVERRNAARAMRQRCPITRAPASCRFASTTRARSTARSSTSSYSLDPPAGTGGGR